MHRLVDTEDYLSVLDGYPTKFAPDERFSYCNGGFVVLALIAERASGVPFHELVAQRVCEPAGMRDTAFLRSDELPGGTALGYLAADGLRTNVLHLPVRGSGDGGIYTTAADVRAFWEALFAGRIVAREWVAEMTRPRSDSPEDDRRYGLGFWLHGTTDAVMLEGYDAGVSFRSLHDPVRGRHRDGHLELERRRLAAGALARGDTRRVTSFRLDRLDHVSLNVSDRPASIAGIATSSGSSSETSRARTTGRSSWASSARASRSSRPRSCRRRATGSRPACATSPSCSERMTSSERRSIWRRVASRSAPRITATHSRSYLADPDGNVVELTTYVR